MQIQLDFNRMGKKGRRWAAIVILIIVVVLALWWLAASQPIHDVTFGFLTKNKPNAAVATSSESVEPSAGQTSRTQKVNRSTQDVRTIAASLSGTSQFNALMRSTGISSTLSSRETYTIFVPTNGAIGQLPGGTIANMTTAEKKRLVQYHIVVGQKIDVDAQVSGTAQALSGDTLNFSFGMEKIPMVNSAIVITAYVGKNGIVYLIDNVLLPPKRVGQ